MAVIVLGGYGEMGQVIVQDLLKAGLHVTIAGRDLRKAQTLAHKFGHRAYALQADTMQPELHTILAGADAVINATQYKTNVHVMKAALRAGVHYLDLGGLFHTTREQLQLHESFKRKGILGLLGCGSTPGITNVLAAWGARQFERVDAIHISFADKDYVQHHQPFIVPYSMFTVFDEFSKPPAVLKKGRLTFGKALEDVVSIGFAPPIGKAKGMLMLHSELATLPHHFGLQDCSFRGCFDPDFIDKVKFLLDTGFASPENRDRTVAILNQFMPTGRVKDVELLRVELRGRAKGKQKKIAVYCEAKSQGSVPAGTWDTGTAPSIMAQMLMRGDVAGHGVMAPEACVPPELFIKELNKRKMRVWQSTIS